MRRARYMPSRFIASTLHSRQGFWFLPITTVWAFCHKNRVITPSSAVMVRCSSAARFTYGSVQSVLITLRPRIYYSLRCCFQCCAVSRLEALLSLLKCFFFPFGKIRIGASFRILQCRRIDRLRTRFVRFLEGPSRTPATYVAVLSTIRSPIHWVFITPFL